MIPSVPHSRFLRGSKYLSASHAEYMQGSWSTNPGTLETCVYVTDIISDIWFPLSSSSNLALPRCVTYHNRLGDMKKLGIRKRVQARRSRSWPSTATIQTHLHLYDVVLDFDAGAMKVPEYKISGLCAWSRRTCLFKGEFSSENLIFLHGI